MKSNIFLRVIILSIVMFGSSWGYADELSKQEALNFASTKGQELLMAFQEPDLDKRYKNLDEMFVEYIDIDYVSKFVMGKYWRKMTKEQQQEYKNIFVRYGLSYYKTLPLDYAKNLTYEIVGAEQNGEFTTVAANIHVKIGQEVQTLTLVFKLHKVDKKVKVVDVKVAESSLLLAYRGKFYEMIAQQDGEISWFLEDLTDLTMSMEYSLRENVSNQQKSLEFGVETR